MFKKLIVLVVAIFTLSGCGGFKPGDFKVSQVSDYDFTLNGRQAASILFTSDKDNYFDITVKRSSIYSGSSVAFRKGAVIKNIDATASINGSNYNIYTNKENGTFVQVVFKAIDRDKNEAKIMVSMKLYSADKDKYFEVDNFTYNISGQAFKNLMIK